MTFNCSTINSCYKCGKAVDRSDEGNEINSIDVDDTAPAYCDNCFETITNNLVCNRIAKFIYQRWFMINQFAEGFIDSLYRKSDEPTYSGELKDGKPHGYGVYRYNGHQYKGAFINGKFDGFGMLKYPDGEKYVGGWKDGDKKGKGILVDGCGIETAYEYTAGGNNYCYGACHICGLNKQLWHIIAVLYLAIVAIIAIASISTAESILMGLLLGIIVIGMTTFVLYIALHFVSFILLIIVKLIG